MWCGVVWCGVVWCGVVWCGVVWCGVVWCGVVWCGVVWCGALCGVGCGVDSWKWCLVRTVSMFSPALTCPPQVPFCRFVYLRGRGSLLIHSNYFGCSDFWDRPVITDNQVGRAASLIHQV